MYNIERKNFKENLRGKTLPKTSGKNFRNQKFPYENLEYKFKGEKFTRVFQVNFMGKLYGKNFPHETYKHKFVNINTITQL